jgi:GH35 family endo-1,4-beta-xylanase
MKNNFIKNKFIMKHSCLTNIQEHANEYSFTRQLVCSLTHFHMKQTYINICKKLKYVVLAMLVLSFNSCYDEKMEWGDPYTHPEQKELPLALQEAISRYEVLNSYTNFVLGVGIDLTLYMNDETYRNIVNENFDEITVGYHMKHGAMVNAQGDLNFDPVDKLMERLQEAGLAVYGHTLVWHQNQNAGYLNNLIKGTPVSANLISNSDFETEISDGNGYGLGAWNSWGGGTSRARSSEGEGHNSGYAMVLTNTIANESNYWSSQATIAFPELLKEGHTYRVELWIKSSVAGARVNLEIQPNESYTQYSGIQEIDTEWEKISWTFVAEDDDASFFINFAYDEAVFYIDDVLLFDIGDVNLISNSDFETEISDGNGYGLGAWNSWGEGTSRARSSEGEGHDSGYAMVLTNTIANETNYWNSQATIDFPEPLTAGHTYVTELWIKSSVAGARVNLEIQPNKEYTQYSGIQEIGTEWEKISWTFTADDDDKKFFINFTYDEATFYIDDVIVYDETAIKSGAGGEVIPLPAEEQTARISAALESWISQMVSHYKDQVHAWDVVNEPMDDGKPSALKTGVGKANLASDEFYWQDYLGKDYGVMAFKLARQYGNLDDKLFINDYNLESSLAKCDGLIAYAQYIESQGVKIDGIGTQMHLSLNSNRDNIVQMFQKLAQTGKLIKISELDIQVGTSSPSVEQYAQQAELYQYVIDMYMQYIPESQRYGVTVWCVSDSSQEHENWLPDDAPCLWDSKYNRKHAYKGFADGLAGKDISEDFTGELQY